MSSFLEQEIHPAVEVRGERAKRWDQTPTQKSGFSKSILDSYIIIPVIMGWARLMHRMRKVGRDNDRGIFSTTDISWCGLYFIQPRFWHVEALFVVTRSVYLMLGRLQNISSKVRDRIQIWIIIFVLV